MDLKRTCWPPVLAWCLALSLLALAGCGSEKGAAWKLWGFETHSFTVGDEEIEMRLDTSGPGRYGVELSDDMILIFRDDEAIMEGYFPMDDYEALRQDCLSAADCQIIEGQEDGAPEMLYRVPDGDSYTFLSQISGASSAALFSVPGTVPAEEALDRAHRLQFTKLGD